MGNNKTTKHQKPNSLIQKKGRNKKHKLLKTSTVRKGNQLKMRAIALVALLGFLIVSPAFADDIGQHCQASCASHAKPSDPESIKALRMIVGKACQNSYRNGQQVGHACQNGFDRVARTACNMGCRTLASPNAIKNTPDIS